MGNGDGEPAEERNDSVSSSCGGVTAVVLPSGDTGGSRTDGDRVKDALAVATSLLGVSRTRSEVERERPPERAGCVDGDEDGLFLDAASNLA